jgi:stage V sporulation protein AA
MAVLYLQAKQKAEVMKAQVCVADIASVYCSDSSVSEKVREMEVCQLQKSRCHIVSVLELIAGIEAMYPGITVENLGENTVVITRTEKNGRLGETVKLIFVMLICFFGTGFTIMAFHNDISIHKMFSRIYEQVMGLPYSGFGAMEVAYSLGLCIGILLFFNHVGRKKITKDPTPIEVEMSIYEEDVSRALIRKAEGQAKDGTENGA